MIKLKYFLGQCVNIFINRKFETRYLIIVLDSPTHICIQSSIDGLQRTQNECKNNTNKCLIVGGFTLMFLI